jgi:subtilase family serine protease
LRQAAGAVLTVAAVALGLLTPGALAVGPAKASPIASIAGARLAGATRVGAAPASQRIRLVLPLKVSDAGLQRLATAVSTPGSSQYGQYESIANLAKRFGASPASRARVVHYLRSAGATGVKIDATGLFADATMPVSVAQKLFGTGLANFRIGRATSFIAPTGAARVPAALVGAVTGVVGLDTRPLFDQAQTESSATARWPHAAAARVVPAKRSTDSAVAHSAASGYVPRTGTPSGCTAAQLEPGFTPNQYLTAYNYAPLQAAGLTGQGERVALIEIDGFRYSDVRAFATCFSLATPAINGFGVGLKHPLAPGGETTLDLEVLDAAAPNLKGVDVYETDSSAADVLQALTAPLQNPGNKPDVISASLGACELITLNSVGSSGINTAEDSLAIAGASGISIMAASGDAGSSACVGRGGEPLPALAVSFPASSPLVTGVGGTNVSLNTANQITAQDVWNDAPLSVAAAGGGVSQLFRRPSYQNGFVTRNRRIVPDVSMLADPAPGYDIYCTAKSECINKDNSNPWIPFGGTSAASPLLAGGIALVDESLRLHQRQDVGLANPLLYQIDHSPEAASVFSDVVTGNNDLGMSLSGKLLGCCTAGPGFDYASGLGSVNLAALSFVASTIVPKIVGVSLSLPGQKPVQRGHLTAKVSCSGRCLSAAYAALALGRTKPFQVFSDVALLKKKGAKTLELKFSKGQLRRLRGALSHREKITATVFGVILDPGGNIERATRGKTLRIRH